MFQRSQEITPQRNPRKATLECKRDYDVANTGYDEKLLSRTKREREAKQKLDAEGGVSLLLEDWKRKQGGKGVEVVELKEEEDR